MGLAETSASARAAARYTSAVTRGLRESAIIALGIVALVLLIALLTYSPDDPGFSFTGNSAPVRNRIGVIGPWPADAPVFLFRRPAFLVPLGRAAAGGAGGSGGGRAAWGGGRRGAARGWRRRVAPPLPRLGRGGRVERARGVPMFDRRKRRGLPPLKRLDDPPPREPLYSAEA